MRINYVKLKNYIGIYNGMGLKEIELDFNDFDNLNMFMVAGENGSGKTTLMTALNPLPGNNEGKIIRANKEGLKILNIENDEFKYEIKHVFSPTGKTHKVSSYITKIDCNDNEIELNPNGNVTSFKEVLDTELGVNDDYLKLIRLGSSFNSFIKMSTAERSKFISQFLSDVNIYLQYHKKVSNDARLLKSLIKNVSGKLDKLGTRDVIESKLSKLDSENLQYEKDKDIIISKISIIDAELERLDNDNIQDIKKTLKENKNNLESYEKKINRIVDSVYQLSGIQSNNYEELNSFLNSSFTVSKNEIQSKSNSYKDTNLIIKSISEDIDNKNIELDRIGDKESLTEIIDKYKETKKKKNKLEEEYGFDTHKLQYSVLDLLSTAELFDGYRSVIETLHEDYSIDDFENIQFNKDYHIDLMRKQTKYKNRITELEQLIIEYSSKITILNNEIINCKEKMKLKPSSCCNLNCPLLGGNINELQSQYNKAEDNYNQCIIDKEKYEDKLESTNNKLDIMNSVAKIKTNINRKQSSLIKIPFIEPIMEEDEFNRRVIYNIPFYDKNDIETYCNIAEEYDQYQKLTEYILPSLEISYNDSISKIKQIDIIKNQLSTSYNTLKIKSNYLEKLQDEIAELRDKLDCINGVSVMLEENENLFSDYDMTKEEVERLQIIFDNHVESIRKIELLNEELKKLNSGLKGVRYNLECNVKERDKYMYKFREIKKSLKEKKLLEDKFKDVEMVRTSLSSNKGIPLIYIELYLQQARLTANELLDKAFGGRLRLEKFVINEKEFRIPFRKTELVNDVSEGSEGEKIIISLVLSFAFTKQIGSKFNIMFLDEVDGPLDKKNRRLFANVIQKQMEILGMEQIFLISHNDAFLSQNTGLILLKDHGLDKVNKNNTLFDYYQIK